MNPSNDASNVVPQMPGNAGGLSDTGDIILTPEKGGSAKGRKGLVFGLIGVLVVVLVVGVIVALNSKTPNLQEEHTAITVEDKEGIGRYMSLVMFGNESSTGKLAAETMTLTTSKAYEAYCGEEYSTDERVDFFKKLRNLLNDLLNNLPDNNADVSYSGTSSRDEVLNSDNSVESHSVSLKSKIELQLTQLETIIAFLNADYINGDVIMLDYLSGLSLNEIEAEINKNYASMKQINDVSAQCYVDVVKAIYDNTKRIINIYSEAGCLADEFASDCLNIEQFEEAGDLLSENQRLMQELNELQDAFIEDFFRTACDIYNSVNDEVSK